MTDLKEYYVTWDENDSMCYTVALCKDQSELKELIRNRQSERKLNGLPRMSHVRPIKFDVALLWDGVFHSQELLKLTGTTLGKRLEDYGYNVKRIEECNPHFTRLGAFEYVVDPQSQYGYVMQVDPCTGESRRRGFGEGCFWTEWEK